MRLSAVVAAYNEENTIGPMLKSLLAQRLKSGELAEVVVVASGCTDRTHAIVEEVMREDPRVRLIVQNARLGKSAALNAYLRERDPAAEVIVFASADLLIQPGCLELFHRELEDSPEVGMVGARPMPVNPRGPVVGTMVNFLWDLHHEISLIDPKMGEMTAARASLVQVIPDESAVDEASVEAIVARQGYKLRYVPGAVVINRGPDSLREFLSQRRRIAAGHYWLRDTTGYEVATLDSARILRLAMKHLTFSSARTDLTYAFAAGVEAVSRALGYFDYKRNHSHAVWEIARSTKMRIEPVETKSVQRLQKVNHG